MYYPYTMGETAENVAKRWNISRHAQDEFAFESQQKYAKALAENKWQDEITPLQVQIGKEVFDFEKDEHPTVVEPGKTGPAKTCICERRNSYCGQQQRY